MTKKLSYTDGDKFMEESIAEIPELKSKMKETELKYQIIEAIVNYKNKFQTSQKAIAEQLGVSQQYISKILKGEKSPSIEFLDKLFKTLDITFTIKLGK